MPVDPMSGATGAPDAYALQSVPWVMYFNDSISLHGTYWHDLFGYRRSHGCVNLSISDAKHLFAWTDKSEQRDDANNPVNPVYVYSSGIYGEPPGQVASASS
ncbi:MAG TPA: L,D-transpeptidase [Phototrophicaceae bacterium]|nr:L,D-transpeptidase [Phototrophicaceae bacterium]